MYKAASLGAINVSLSLLDGLTLAAKHGFEGIEIDPQQALTLGIDSVKTSLADHRLLNAGFGLPVAFRAQDEAYKASLTAFPALVKAAAALGATRCCTYILPWHDTLSYEENYALHLETLTPCATILKDYGITLGLEFVGPQTMYRGKAHHFIHTLPDMLMLAQDIGTGNVGLLVDAYHCYTAGHSMDVVRELRDEDIVLVHVSDALPGMTLATLPDTHRCLPGESGVVPLLSFMRTLKEIGYTGPVVVEPFSDTLAAMTDNDVKLTAVINALDAIWP